MLDRFLVVNLLLIMIFLQVLAAANSVVLNSSVIRRAKKGELGSLAIRVYDKLIAEVMPITSGNNIESSRVHGARFYFCIDNKVESDAFICMESVGMPVGY